MNNHVGLGFRRDIAEEVVHGEKLHPGFIEFAPENWMDMGGYWNKMMKKAVQKYPVLSHGLSLSIGSPESLDWNFIKKLKSFIKDYDIQIYSEHLSYTKSANAHLYDLLPIPFRQDAVEHVAQRVMQVQDFLGMKITLENVSYYTPVAAEMEEHEFINSIVDKADCNLLLDINNVYVNAFNHKYDAREFIKQLPLDRVKYIHMAGHEQVEPDLIIDTHGQPIIDPVYDLFEWTLEHINPVPVLLERDYNFQNVEDIQKEMDKLEEICKKTWEVNHETFA